MRRFVIFCSVLLSATASFAQTYATVPYYTGFESGALDASWTATSSQPGVNIEVIQSGTLTWSSQTAYSYAGNYFLGMDFGTGGSYNLNQGDLHLNLNGESGLRLSFKWAEWNDETEAEDGIFVSDDDGATFTKILDLDGAATTDLTWVGFNMSLDSINALYGLSFTSTYIIRFQQYDNYYFAGGNDGFLFDEINVNTTCPATSALISPAVCESYTVPSGDETYTASGMYYDTIPNAAGCDSVITIDLTILQPSTGSVTESACDSYMSAGGTTYTSSGTYTELFTNAAGCDSIVTINLTINSSTTATISETALDSYTAPSGAVYTTPGTYTDVIPNAAGCDSVIIINLSMNYTGLNEYGKSLIQAYPNPVQGTLHISGLNDLSGIEAIVVYDMNGRIAGEIAVTSDTFDATGLQSGVYYLAVTHSHGTSRISFVRL